MTVISNSAVNSMPPAAHGPRTWRTPCFFHENRGSSAAAIVASPQVSTCHECGCRRSHTGRGSPNAGQTDRGESSCVTVTVAFDSSIRRSTELIFHGLFNPSNCSYSSLSCMNAGSPVHTIVQPTHIEARRSESCALSFTQQPSQDGGLRNPRLTGQRVCTPRPRPTQHGTTTMHHSPHTGWSCKRFR